MNWFAVGATLAGLAVALGAFGAHGLKTRVTPDLLIVFETAVRYHMYHALALLAVAWAATRWPHAQTQVQAAGFLFLIGIIIFSGSLYTMTLTGMKWLGAITPIGGVAFMLGWAALAWAATTTAVGTR